MSDIAIRVENLSKQYRIGRLQERHDTLRDSLMAGLQGVGQRLSSIVHPPSSDGDGRRTTNDEFVWALRDVSFEVRRGEVLGIIGRNGAGKSTLLKILSRITEPTSGRAEIHGRVGSLLEVGTGFHPELSGRENIYLNGAILGMRKAEIEHKFDEIVAFAEIEKFLDTPVKRYSSGMYVRLAFAVAAHLEPEILLVDEVLAVGDLLFQQKCLGKMDDIAKEGRTVLFVSHNMIAIRSLCSRALLLESGCLSFDDSSERCISAYINRLENARAGAWAQDRRPDSPLIIRRVSAELCRKQPSQQLVVDIYLESRGDHRPAFVAIDIVDTINSPLMQAIPALQPFITHANRFHKLQVSIELPPLIPGRYSLSVWVGSHNTDTLDFVENCVAVNIAESPTKGRSFPHTVEHGHIVPNATVEYSAALPKG
jgi:lipopolysaccharide transport system ATP-binding protein